MRKLLSLALLLSSLFGLTIAPAAAQTDDEWRLHLSYHNAMRSVAVGDLVYLVPMGTLGSGCGATGGTRG